MSYTPNNAQDRSRQTGLARNPGPFIAEVMKNDDPLYSGRLMVYVPEFGGDQSQESSWDLVQYMSPYYGIQPLSNSNAADPAAQHESYGMWMQPPDLGVKVLVMFVNGDRSKGVWIGCLPEIGSHGAIPGQDAGDFDRYQNQSALNSDIQSIPRPPHSTAPTFVSQGLADDEKRGGTITTSSLRESPSNVFGFNTPGGHSFFMDDGDTSEQNKMLRIRTATGNMIMMNDDDGFIYIINSAGTGWIELSPSGHIDMYGQSGISFATDGDINMHASGSINMHANQSAKIIADKELKLQGSESAKIYGGSLSLQGNDSIDIFSCGEFRQTANQGFQFKSGAEFVIEGRCFKWNSGGAAEASQVSPEPAADITGYQSTVTRAPNREPWAGHDPAYQPPAPGIGSAPYTGAGNASIINAGSVDPITGGTPVGQMGVYIIGDSHAAALGGSNNSAVNGARLNAIGVQANSVPPNSQVVMTGGHNDVAFGSSASQIADRVASIIRDLQSKGCEVTYILFPVGTRNPNQENMAPTRQAIRSAISGVTIVDLEGQPMSSDGQHSAMSVYRNITLPTARQTVTTPSGGSYDEAGITGTRRTTGTNAGIAGITEIAQNLDSVVPNINIPNINIDNVDTSQLTDIAQNIQAGLSNATIPASDIQRAFSGLQSGLSSISQTNIQENINQALGGGISAFASIADGIGGDIQSALGNIGNIGIPGIANIAEIGNVFESIGSIQDILPIGPGLLNSALSITSGIANVEGLIQNLAEPLTSITGLLDTVDLGGLSGLTDVLGGNLANLNLSSIGDVGGLIQGLSGIGDIAGNLTNLPISLPAGLTDILPPDLGDALGDAAGALGSVFGQDPSTGLSPDSADALAPNSSVGGSCSTPALRSGPGGNIPNPGGSGGGSGGGAGGSVPPGVEEGGYVNTPAVSQSAAINGVLDFIAEYESTGDYNRLNGTGRADLVNMTIAEIYQLQDNYTSWPNGESSAIGRYQYIRDTLEWMVGRMRLNTSTLFNEQTQDAIATHDMRFRCDLDEWLAGQISDARFLNLLAAVWASIPNTGGESTYIGVGSNRAGVSVTNALSRLAEIKTRVA